MRTRSSTTSKAPFPDAPEILDDQSEHVMKRQASEFLKEQKRLIRRRQAAMHKAREEWQRNAELLDDVYPNTERAELVRVLTQVRPLHSSGACIIPEGSQTRSALVC